MSSLKERIIEFKNKNLSYGEISRKLNCSKSSVCYHLSNGQKEKYKKRLKKFREKSHPYIMKTYSFLYTKPTEIIVKNKIYNADKLLYKKICRFNGGNMKNVQFTAQDVINKFGEAPKCYLTGEQINIYKPRTYHFDHIIPTSRGGTNTLDNLGICVKIANMSKQDMTKDEYLKFCQKVLEYNGFEVKQVNKDLHPD